MLNVLILSKQIQRNQPINIITKPFTEQPTNKIDLVNDHVKFKEPNSRV
jgi:hypothetical protein